jgi:magnesium transporter
LRKEASEVETINYVYVVNRAEVLRGVVSLKELILAHNQDLIRKIMQKRLISVKFHDSVKDVAEMFGKYNFTMLPVTDEKERLLGVVQWIDAVEAVYPEFARD